MLGLLTRLKIGTLTLHAPDGNCQIFWHARSPFAALHIHRWEVCSEVLKSGDIGFAEGFMAGDWDTPDLAGLLRLLIANRTQIEGAIYGHWLGRLLYRVSTCSTATTAPTAAKTSTRTTTWAMLFTSCGWMAR